MIFKISIFKSAPDFNFIHTISFLIPIALFSQLITSVFNKKINKILSYVIVSSTIIIFIAQFIYYKTYSSVFSIYSMGKGGQIFEFFETILKIMYINIFYILLFLIPIIVFIIFNKHLFNHERIVFKDVVILLFSFLTSQLLANGILLIPNDETYSAKVLYYDKHSPTLAINKFGLLTMMRLDLKRLLIGFEEKEDLVSNPQNDNKVIEEEVEEITYNIMNIDFDSLIEKENNQTIKDMHSYFKNTPPTNQNEYTGMFKGKNLIFFMGESFNSLAIDKNITPTLYKLYNEGFTFTNFYNPLFPVSTTDGEYIMATSLIPKEGVWSSYQSRNNYFPFVLGNAFKKLGYKTTAYHNHSATYYYRTDYIPNWGYEYYACRKGLNINCKLWPESDLEMIDVTYNDYVNKSPFMTYYITVSGHLNYTRGGNAMVRKNWSYVKDLPYSDKPKGYLSTHVELDKALENLIKYLDEAGVLKDTVIALGADHYPYGLSLDEINEIAEPNRDDNFEKHRSAFLLWNSEMEPVIIDKLSSSLDILPTILNLFGIEYDSRLLMGKDIMSDEEPIVIFSNRSFITDKGRYNPITKKFIPHEDETVDEEYINRISNIIDERYYLSRKIIELDYYKIIFDN